MKRSIAILAVLVMLLGCVSAMAEELAPAEVNLWLMGPGKQADSDKVWEAFNEKLAETVPNTKVNFTVIDGGEYLQRFNNMLAAGEPVDLAWIGYATNLTQDQIDGNLLPLDELIEKYGQGIVETLGQNVIDMHRAADGNVYYLISWQGLYTSPSGVFIPTALITEHVGEQWIAEFQDALNALSASPNYDTAQACYDKVGEYLQALVDDGCIYGGIQPQGSVFAQSDRFKLYGRAISYDNLVYVNYGDDTFTAKAYQASESTRQGYMNSAEFYQKGYVMPDIATMQFGNWADNPDGSYDANDPVFSSHGYTSDDQAATLSVQNHRDMTVFHLDEVGMLSLGSLTGMAIPYCAANPERAMMVLNQIYANPELYQLLIYGLEGVHWQDNGDGTVTTLCGSGQGNSDWAYGLWKWTIGSCLNSFTTQTDTAGYYQSLIAKEKDAYISPFLSFQFDSSSVAALESALLAIVEEYRLMLWDGYLGAEWETYYNEMNERLENAGLDEFIAEYQRQLNAFAAERGITSWEYSGQ